MTYRKKLIEIALPLEAINRESAHEKSVPRKGHPATMHLWWARRPLAACRAVLFSSLVDDPSSLPDEFPTQKEQDQERERLFRVLEALIRWENSGNDAVLAAARKEIERSTGGDVPSVLDPFCGGGSIPFEGQRLGLRVHASDLNPVAVTITKALTEIPQRFGNLPPVHPSTGALSLGNWSGVAGLVDDIRYYGRWVREEAARRIGHLYPIIKSDEDGGADKLVIAWLWARTVKCANPGCGGQMPLVRSFQLSSKKGKKAWIEPIIDRERREVSYQVRHGEGAPSEGTVGRQGAHCIFCRSPVPLDHIRSEGKAGRLGTQLMAIVAEGERKRAYLSPIPNHEDVAKGASPHSPPDSDLPERALGFRVQAYGMTRHRDLFTDRQLVALETFADLVLEIRDQVLKDAVAHGLADDGLTLPDGGAGPTAYADAVATYLAFAIDKLADWSSTICSWIHSIEGVRDTFARQAIPMVWDFVEINPLSNSVGNYLNHVEWVAEGLTGVSTDRTPAVVRQLDATTAINGGDRVLVCTDPPYYDNIGYADLSDFFYVWLRKTLNPIYPELFSTLVTPKSEELIATPFRFGGNRHQADNFFEQGLGKAFALMRGAQHPDFPLTLFYAFKQAETSDDSDPESMASALASTGWETMLEGLLGAGLAITGTWPMRTERSARSVGIGTNALASSIVLVCRPRVDDAPLATRREFIARLKRELPAALRSMQHGNIAPVDLAQAAIGPGMAVYSNYARIVEADGSPMRVRAALALINQSLDEVLAEQESEYDPSTRWAIAWFEQFGMQEGLFGVAETLSKAKNTSVSGLVSDGILYARRGKVRLLSGEELSADWDPATDARLTVWEITQHLVHALGGLGESGAAEILRKVGALGEVARDLAYRLYMTCERKKWAQEALGYNALVVVWPEVQRLAAHSGSGQEQGDLFTRGT